MYLAHPGHKWLAETVAEMTIKPPNLAWRLGEIWRMEPETAVASLHTILKETLDLAEHHFPDQDITLARQAIRRRRLPVDPQKMVDLHQ